MSQFPYKLSWAIFAAAALPLIWVLSHDFRPQPIYPNLGSAPARVDLERFHRGEWLDVEFEAPKENLNGFYWHQLLPSSRLRLEVRVTNLTQQNVLYEGVNADANPVTEFNPRNAPGDRIQLSLRAIPEEAPLIYVEESGVPFLRFSVTKEVSNEAPEGLKTARLGPNQPTVLTFAAEEADLRVVAAPDLLQDNRSRVAMLIVNETSGAELKKTSWSGGDASIKMWSPNNAVGDWLRVELTWTPARMNLEQSAVPPAEQLLVKLGGEEIDFTPVFQTRYEWMTRGIWFSALVVCVGVFALAGRWRWPAVVVASGLFCVIVSLNFWQQNYTLVSTHTDPDRYGRYGEFLHQIVFDSSKRAEVLANPEFRDYPHSYVAFVPAILAGLRAIGLPKDVAYPILVAISAVGVLLLLRHIGRTAFGLSDRLLMVGVLMLAAHMVFLKAFARPSTDMPGVLAGTAMIAVLLWRLREETRSQLWLAALLGLALVMVRPIGPLYLFFFGCGFVSVDWIRERQLRPLKRIATGFAVAGPATAIFALCFWIFGWKHNLELAFEKKTEFYGHATLRTLLETLPAVLQLLPLLWVRVRLRNRSEWLGAAVIGAWLLFYLMIIVVVRAPFVTLLFLPVIPFLVLFGLVGLRELKTRFGRWVAYSLIVAAAAANIGVTIYLATLPALPPAPFSQFIY